MAEYKLTFGDRTLTFPQWNGYVSFQAGPTFQYTTLWETSNPFKNMYSITLNDSLYNYDQYIVYGSAIRDSQLWLNTQNRYVVTQNKVNRGGCYYAGKWSDGLTYLLMNGTDMWLSGTSGYITSSYFFGQDNGSTAFCKGCYNTARNVDLHPYKIVGVKEVQ